jgi:predicted dehydrogenase
MSEQAILKWGILGAARVNEKLLPAIMASDNAELVAVASRREGAAAEVIAKYAPENKSILAFDTPEPLINHSEIDAIYLPMANEEHTEWALKAIAAGKHVLIEKPMALSVSDIEQIEAAAIQHNVTVMEGFMYVFHPQHDFVHKIIDSGVIGDVRTVRTCFSFPMKPARLYRLNRDISNGGGAMWDIGPYAIHTARKWFNDEPISVMAMAKYVESGADISLSGVIDYDDGRFAQFDMSFERARRSEYEIIGTLGGIKCETVWINPDDAPVVKWWTDAGEQHEAKIEMGNHFDLEIAHFSRCVLNNEPTKLTFEDAKSNCNTITAALESAKSGKKVTIQ